MIKHQKNIIFAGDLNINVLDYESNKNVQHFLSGMFQYNMIHTIIRPTRVTRNLEKSYRLHYYKHCIKWHSTQVWYNKN